MNLLFMGGLNIVEAIMDELLILILALKMMMEQRFIVLPHLQPI